MNGRALPTQQSVNAAAKSICDMRRSKLCRGAPVRARGDGGASKAHTAGGG